ncbi:hypothetical protein K435DRAFT_942635 [Dendrothele bispora CBS 962.96]|uniref:Uncharacterized protein n=1 Tax=Dendrothele bispora (strain CBS 962.96) TaxID=1314807 RepID=A0A4S8KUQ6_DENBC|nr:hypothetical protein K435DRAFT_942635 [Dendrothele bispora CBS 962.96]
MFSLMEPDEAFFESVYILMSRGLVVVSNGRNAQHTKLPELELRDRYRSSPLVWNEFLGVLREGLSVKLTFGCPCGASNPEQCQGKLCVQEALRWAPRSLWDKENPREKTYINEIIVNNYKAKSEMPAWTGFLGSTGRLGNIWDVRPGVKKLDGGRARFRHILLLVAPSSFV